MRPIGFHGEYVLVQKPGPGPHVGRVFSIWSRWLNILQEKSWEEFQSTDARFIPILHPVEMEGYMGSQIWASPGVRVPEM